MRKIHKESLREKNRRRERERERVRGSIGYVFSGLLTVFKNSTVGFLVEYHSLVDFIILF